MLTNYTIIILALLTVVTAGTEASMPVNKILDKYAENQERCKSFIIKSLTENRIKLDSGSYVAYEKSEIRTDGDRTYYSRTMWGNVKTSVNVSKKNPYYTSYLWDGKNFYRNVVGYDVSEDQVLIEERDPVKRKVGNFEQITLSKGHDLLGYFNGDKVRFDEVLRKADNVVVTDLTDDSSGCYLLEAKTKRGKYKVWIDPKHGYNVAKAEVTRKPGDVAFKENYILNHNEKVFGELNNVKFEQVDGVWLPKVASIVHEYRSRSGATEYENLYHQRKNISLAPDHEALSSFLPKDIRNGAKVHIYPINNISYTWQDGELITNVDAAAIDQLDKMMAEVLADSAKGDALAEGEALAKGEALAEDIVVVDELLILENILAEYRKTQKQVASFYCVSKTSEDQNTTLSRYALDGKRFSVRARTNGQAINDLLWAGKHGIYSSGVLGRSMSVQASADDKKSYQLLATVYPGAGMLGYFNGQPERIDAILSAASEGLTVDEGKLNDKSCYVVTASVGKDTYRIWFSLEDGYQIIKAKVESNSKVVYLMDEVKVDKVEDSWVPMSCMVKDLTRQYSYKRTRVVLKPNFEKLKAFDLPISNGTSVKIENMPGKFVWRNGHVIDKEGRDVF